MLKEFGPSLYAIDGTPISFFGLTLPTRMVVARLNDGSLWVWSPVALTPEIEDAVRALGPVRHIVSPNKVHHLSLTAWSECWPDARVYGPPGLAKRRPQIHFHSTLLDTADSAWASEIDQMIFKGSFALEEVVFFHKPSETAIVGDLVLRIEREQAVGLGGLIMRSIGIVGENGKTPLELRATYLRRAQARASRERLLAWQPKQLIVAHGACAERDATSVLNRSLAWI